MRLYLPDEARYWRGEHESAELALLANAIRPGGIVYDVGAHVGYFSFAAVQLTGPAGRVIAFEPEPENAARLRANVLRNQLQARVELVEAAVWSTSVRGGICFRRGTGMRTQGGVEARGIHPVLANGEAIRVDALDLDSFIAAGNPPPHVIKIDVEGAEYETLRGGAEVFAKYRPLIFAEIHTPLVADQIAGWLADHGYCAQWVIPPPGFPRHLLATPASPLPSTAVRPWESS